MSHEMHESRMFSKCVPKLQIQRGGAEVNGEARRGKQMRSSAILSFFTPRLSVQKCDFTAQIEFRYIFSACISHTLREQRAAVQKVVWALAQSPGVSFHAFRGHRIAVSQTQRLCEKSAERAEGRCPRIALKPRKKRCRFRASLCFFDTPPASYPVSQSMYRKSVFSHGRRFV